MPLFSREVLQGMITGQANDDTAYIAAEAIPAITGPSYGIFVSYDQLAAISGTEDLEVASCSQAVQLPKLEATGTNYSTRGFAAKDVVCFDEEVINQTNRSLAQFSADRLRHRLLLQREMSLETLIRTSTWNSASGAVAADDQWDTGTGDPWKLIFEASQAIPGGANTVIMGQAAFESFLTNDKAIGYLANDSFKFLSKDSVKRYMMEALGLKLYVSGAQSSAGYVFDDDVFVARIDGNGGVAGNRILTRPTALMRVVSQDIELRSKEIFDAGVRGGELFRASMDEVILQATPALGVLRTAVNG